MAHRKDRKEALRREREERERQARDAARRKRAVGYGVAAALAVAVIAAGVVLATGGDGGGGSGPDDSADIWPEGGSVPEQSEFDVRPAAEAAGCELRSRPGSGTATHTGSLDVRVDYDTNPPTTGRHYDVPAEDGIYGEAPPDEALVHSLEHGRVIIWAKPGLAEEQRAQLRALVEEDDYQMFLVPRRDMPSAVAATAWNGEPEPNGTARMLLCDEVGPQTWDALRAFRDEHRSRGPEPIP